MENFGSSACYGQWMLLLYLYVWQELVKEKEQWSRKYQQEVDSLSFRNQQLSKRVMVLQDELEALESQKKKHKVSVSVCELMMWFTAVWVDAMLLLVLAKVTVTEKKVEKTEAG